MSVNKEQIYTDYHNKILGYILSQVNDYNLAEDLCSDVFVKVYEKIDTFNSSKASFSTWIFTITRNKLIDYYRQRKVMVEIPETLAYEEEDDEPKPEDLETLSKALDSLNDREKKIIVKHYYNKEKLKDIAIELNISYAYVKILHNKALLELKKYFSSSF